MAAMFGGVVGQEVVKALSGKFHPLFQWCVYAVEGSSIVCLCRVYVGLGLCTPLLAHQAVPVVRVHRVFACVCARVCCFGGCTPPLY